MDEVVIRSGRQMRLGDTDYEVVGSETAPLIFHDASTEACVHNGIIHLSLATLELDIGERPRLNVRARVRMSQVTAQAVHDMLGQMLKDANRPPDLSKAN